jgi:hypothetical protein
MLQKLPFPIQRRNHLNLQDPTDLDQPSDLAVGTCGPRSGWSLRQSRHTRFLGLSFSILVDERAAGSYSVDSRLPQPTHLHRGKPPSAGAEREVAQRGRFCGQRWACQIGVPPRLATPIPSKVNAAQPAVRCKPSQAAGRDFAYCYKCEMTSADIGPQGRNQLDTHSELSRPVRCPQFVGEAAPYHAPFDPSVDGSNGT